MPTAVRNPAHGRFSLSASPQARSRPRPAGSCVTGGLRVDAGTAGQGSRRAVGTLGRLESGGAIQSGFRWCFDPVRPRSTGLGPVWFLLLRLARGWSRPPPVTSQDGPPRRVRPAALRAAAARRQPRSSPRSPPAGHARAGAQLLGLALPLDAGVQHEEDSAQHLSVRQRPAPGCRNRRSLCGSSGPIRSHRPSDTIHGEAPMPRQR